MPEFFLELFSEEIPARFQLIGMEDLYAIVNSIALQLDVGDTPQPFSGPRRIAVSAKVANEKPGAAIEVRGPRSNAPEGALAGFLGKHKANREELLIEDGYYVFRRNQEPVAARQFIEKMLPEFLAANMRWPKSMRWGSSDEFSWVRPLRRITCLLDGQVIPITLGPVTAGNETEGHRVHAPGAFSVESLEDWKEKLRTHYVIADQDERRKIIVDGINTKAAELGLNIVEDEGLIYEVNGLVEWPVPLIGKIDQRFMDLPTEVRELSMRVNQKYFALRDAQGHPAPYFAFVANLEAPDGGAAIIAGNERVLRARLSDARHFWDLDLKTPLDELLPKLKKITFHAKIGSQADRVKRIEILAREIAAMLGADAAQAGWAGKLCKADLVTGMVGEFPELQGIMGGYYAERNPRGWDGTVVGPAISTHYQPKGPSDAVPTGAIAVSVALADKLDTLVQFFRINEKPTGSGDPYALRRAALGVIRIILENNLRLPLKPLLGGDVSLFDFMIERLRVKLRGEGKRFDVLDAVLAAGADDDLVRLIDKVEAISTMLTTDYGLKLLNAYRRAANILKIEELKDGPHTQKPDAKLCLVREEERLYTALNFIVVDAFIGTDHTDAGLLADGKFDLILRSFADLGEPVDKFFEKVTVNAPEPELRLNRLRLLAKLRLIMHQIADFSKIEG